MDACVCSGILLSGLGLLEGGNKSGLFYKRGRVTS